MSTRAAERTSVAKRRLAGVSAAVGAGSVRRRDLMVIGGAALVVRLAWVLLYGRTAPGPNDTGFYETAASMLARGHGFANVAGQATAHWPPGFPFVVSLLYRGFGVHPEIALGLNVALGTATAILLYLIAERMFGRAAARIAGGSFVILPGPVFLTALFLSETTFIFTLVAFLALVLFMPERRWTPVALGIALGLAALVRGEGFLALVIPLAAWWGHVPRAVWLRRAALLIVSMVLTIAPWTIRNAIALHTFVPVSTNASASLWVGHNPKANGGEVYYFPPYIASQLKNLDLQAGEVKESRVLRQEAIKWAVHNPLKELGLIPRKLVALSGGASGALNEWLNAPGDREVHSSGGLVFGILGDALGYFLLFATLASLIVIGARRLWRMHPGMQAILAYLALCLVNYGFVYDGQWRYQIPMQPLMLLVATPLLLAVWSQRGTLQAVVGTATTQLRGEPAAVGPAKPPVRAAPRVGPALRQAVAHVRRSRAARWGGVLLLSELLRLAGARGDNSWQRFGLIDVLVVALGLTALVAGSLGRGERMTVGAARAAFGACAGVAFLLVLRVILPPAGVGLAGSAVSPGHDSALATAGTVLALIGMVGLAGVIGRPELDSLHEGLRSARLRVRSSAQAHPTVAVLIGGAGVLAAFVYLFRLGTPSWVTDELTYRFAAHQYIGNGVFGANREHPFLAKDILGVFQGLLGTSTADLRLGSALAGLLTGGVLFALGRRMAGLGAGLVAFALWAFLPHPLPSPFGDVGPIKLERFGLLDTFMVFFSAVGLWLGWLWVETGRWRAAVGSGVAIGLAMACKETGVLFLPGIVVVGAAARPNARVGVAQAAALAAAAGVTALLTYLPPLGGGLGAISDMFHLENLHSTAGHAVIVDGRIYVHPPWWSHLWWQAKSVGTWPSIALGACAVFSPFVLPRRTAAYLLAAIAVPFLWLSFGVGFKLPHYYLTWQAPLALLAGLVIWTLASSAGWQRILAAALAVPLVVASLGTVADVAKLRPTDYVAVARFLSDRGQANGLVLDWCFTGVPNAYLPNATISQRPPPGGFPATAIVLDPDATGPNANPSLEQYLFQHRAEYSRYRVGRLDLWVSGAPAPSGDGARPLSPTAPLVPGRTAGIPTRACL
jgi:4-amino-4-deoxy-L-arabinose transferase-like glycosyltransferase